MKKSIKERFYPTEDQEKFLAQVFGCCRFVWNEALEYRSKAYEERKESINYYDLSKRLKDLRKEFDWLSDTMYSALQGALRDQEQAFKKFFSKKAKYPRFKKKGGRQSFRLGRTAFRLKEGKLFIAKCKEPLDVRWTRELPSDPSSITVSRDCAGRYFVSLVCEFTPEPMRVVPKMIGLDLGLKDLVTTDTGEKYANPKYYRKYEGKLKYLQRQLSRKTKGSKNRGKAKVKVARLFNKIADSRRDYLHKISRKIVDENQVISVESLSVKNMARNRSLSKSIMDAGWAELLRQLTYKALWAGRTLVQVDKFFPSSKICSSCGHKNDSLTLADRTWVCANCGVEHDRDTNAAKNILTAGLAGLACGVTGTGTIGIDCLGKA